MDTATHTDRAAGAIYGLALGDAWGDPLEFRSIAEILRAGGGEGPWPTQKLRVTDDTQMSLAVWQALTTAGAGADVDEIREQLMTTFLTWLDDPDNNRAPGATCMGALRTLKAMPRRSRRNRWHRATVRRSAGCGTVMRAPWIGVHPAVESRQAAEAIAQLQAVLTHGHAASTAAAAAAAGLTWALARGEVQLGECGTWLRAWSEQYVNQEYATSVMGPVGGRSRRAHAQYMREGARAVWKAGKRAQDAVTAMTTAGLWAVDPCTIAGQGWDAATCLAVAVACADLAPKVNPVDALRRAAATNGDSDSIAAVAGALIGAGSGQHVWPTEWLGRIEERYQLELSAATVDVPTLSWHNHA